MSESPRRGLVLGWNVGGTSSSLAVATPAGELVERDGWPSSPERGPDAMIAEFLDRARPVAGRHEVARVGVSIGGPLNTLTGRILSPPHLPGWDDVPLADVLSRELGLEAVVEHDAAACLEAEWFWGAARGATHAAYLTCGTGIGAGLMIGGRVVRGPLGETPEAGHIRLAPDGPEAFGKRGCAESFASGDGMSMFAAWRFPERFAGSVTPEELKALSDSGDADARAVLDEAARRTGELAAILADLFAPEVVVLGSLARYLGPGWVELIRGRFREEALPANSERTRIVPSELAERLQDLSAVAPAVFAERAG
ncbi:MAG: ROK family protein [Planctomycetota bacterium]